MGQQDPLTDPNRDITMEIAVMPQQTIRASTPQHARRLVPPVVVRTRDLRIICGFGQANFQFYVKVLLCNPGDGAAVDEDNPLVGGTSQMITQRHARCYTFDMRDPGGPCVYFIFGDLELERPGEFELKVNMQAVDYRQRARGHGPREQPLRYGGEACTRRFTVVEHAITKEPDLLCMSGHHEIRLGGRGSR